MLQAARAQSRNLSPFDTLLRLLSRSASRIALLLGVTLLTACATRPPATAFDRSETHALPTTTQTALGDALALLERAHPGESGFRLLPTGTEALQMRIALARSATKTLDMQYYIADEDTTGKLLLAAALYAADHGVRVRMLVDDLNFKDIDDVMAALSTHPNIEVRVFNPFASAQYGMFRRTADVFTKIDNFTRRMHNKAMIADNQLAIVGGRNLGDEYFSASNTLQFRDLDVLAAGPIAADVSASFDQFWNSSISYPLRVLNRQSFDPQKLDSVRDQLRQHWRTNADPYNAKPLNATPLASQIAKEQLGLTWAPAEFKSDTPDKISHPSDDYVSPPMKRLSELMSEAQREFLVVSPYFVPHDTGIKSLGSLVRRGVKVQILTNSLAATDAVAVQAGYSPYRVPLLKAGVELYEFKPNPASPHADVAGSRSRASLHAKTYVVDRKILVIGSMNLDPRSAHLNTELALVIHSPTLADQVAQMFQRAISPDVSYRVTLATPAELAERRSVGAPPSKLVWTDRENNEMRTWELDPNAGFYRNLMTGLFLLLPVDGEL
ncbi:phospholipase D family protein [Paraburkholderia phosphatilytica]|uniref:phospholipase D family protein n=1 Tax=Paraburkholderia phosphatilytica TaxID=2282883 RepID=UPI000E46C722|nr:phospholipase D family protein [Paraburkholderia phosphatilytica]